jgi:tetratricopeptide (TPR) repeat protein
MSASLRQPVIHVAALLQDGLRAHRAGQLAVAERAYRLILDTDPDHADALHLLGVAANQQGRADEAIALISRAVALCPAMAAYRVNLGNAHANAGDFVPAIAAFRAGLSLAPDLAEAHGNLGSALLMHGEPAAASASFCAALALQPDCGGFHAGLGNALAERGTLDEAIGCYRTALSLAPGDPDTLYGLGNALCRQGRHDDAIACYLAGLGSRPDHPETLNNLGAALRDSGRAAEAVACCRRAIALRPDYAEAHNTLGTALRDLALPDAAISSYRTALRLMPGNADMHYNLGTTLMGQDRAAEAASSLECALGLRPDFAEAQTHLGNALREQGQLDQAEVCCRNAVALRPDLAEAHNNLGIVLRDQDRTEDAIASFGAALQLAPTLAEAHNNLGIALHHQGSPAEAVDSFHLALGPRPDFPEAHANLGMALLALGRYEEGWREYEWRWRTPLLAAARRDFVQPQWRGEPAVGRTLLIHAEQGFGDSLQFCRFATAAASRGLHVVLEAPRPLLRLLQGLAGVCQLVAYGDPLPPFDLHCPMLSLPLALGTTLDSVPAPTGYLKADPVQASRWSQRLAASGGQTLRVGLVWAGSPRAHTPVLATVDRRRSLAPDRLAPLFDLPGIQFVSLQKDGPTPTGTTPLIDVMDEMEDFADTAALVAGLDLVVSVDTAMAHLAGALGTPVWLLNRFDSCWRWLTGRRDSPWYPSLRLYRQPAPGDWDSVLADVARDLRTLAETGPGASRRTRR